MQSARKKKGANVMCRNDEGGACLVEVGAEACDGVAAAWDVEEDRTYCIRHRRKRTEVKAAVMIFQVAWEVEA